jgi:hypothetical protein
MHDLARNRLHEIIVKAIPDSASNHGLRNQGKRLSRRRERAGGIGKTRYLVQSRPSEQLRMAKAAAI